MTRVYQFATHGYALADAQHVLKAVTKHWPSLQVLGATDSERKRFAATIAEAERFADPKAHGPVALEEARQALKDLLVSYRSAASLIVHGIDGRDAKAEEALKTAKTDIDIALAQSELVVMAAQLAALRKYRDKK